MNLAKTARNAAVADIALAFARDRLAAQLPGVQPRKRRRPGAKSLLLGGAAVAGAELSDFYANLRAPILIAEGQGHQVINESADAPVRAPLFPAVAAAA